MRKGKEEKKKRNKLIFFLKKSYLWYRITDWGIIYSKEVDEVLQMQVEFQRHSMIFNELLNESFIIIRPQLFSEYLLIRKA